jgi:hypothetical protein
MYVTAINFRVKQGMDREIMLNTILSFSLLRENQEGNSFENGVCLICVEYGPSMVTKIKKKYV